MAKKSKALKIGLGVAAVTALAVGTYMLYGPNGKKNRKALKSWMLKAKAEVLEKIENAKSMTAEKYHDVVDAVTAKYAKMGANKAEVMDLMAELKGYAKSAKKAVKKTAKKVVKAKPKKRK